MIEGGASLSSRRSSVAWGHLNFLVKMPCHTSLVGGLNTAPCRRYLAVPAVSVQTGRHAATCSSRETSVPSAATPLWPAQWPCQLRRKSHEQLSRRRGEGRLPPCYAALASNLGQLRQPGADLEQVRSDRPPPLEPTGMGPGSQTQAHTRS